MRFAPDSVSGQRLVANGVGEAEIAATRWYILNLQFGAAITLPLPFLGTTVFIKRAWLVLDENGDLADVAEIRMPVHERPQYEHGDHSGCCDARQQNEVVLMTGDAGRAIQ